MLMILGIFVAGLAVAHVGVFIWACYLVFLSDKE